MNEQLVLGFLGLVARSGQMVTGQTKCTAGVRNGSIKLLLLDGGVSDGTRKSFTDSCTSHHVPCILLNGMDVLGPSIGKPNCRVAGIKDAGLARSVIEKYGDKLGKGTD